MDPVTIAALSALIGSGLSGWSKGKDFEWSQDALMNALNRANVGDDMGRAIWQMNYDPLRQATIDPLMNIGGFLNNQAPWLMQHGESLWSNIIPGLYQNAGSQYYSPEMQAFMGQAGQMAGGLQGAGDIALQGFMGGGWTPQYQAGFDQISPYMAGRGSNSQLALGDVGSNLIGQRGQTAFTQGLQDRGMDAANAGGMNPWLANAMNQASQAIGQGGYTPQIGALSGMGMQQLMGGGATPASSFGQGIAGIGLAQEGATPYTQAMLNRGLELADTDALLTREQAANFAREQSGADYANQAEALYRQAQARGGGPQSQTFSGQQSQMMADFGDRALRGQSEAMRNAMLGQQGLLQKQQQIGSEMLGQGTGLETARLGQFGDLLTGLEGATAQRFGIGASLAGDAERAAAQRYATAMGAIPGTQSAATSQMDALLRAALGGSGQEIDRMGLGANMSNILMQNQLGYGNLYNNMMGNQNQYALGLGGLGRGFQTDAAGMYQMPLQMQIAAAQLGLQGAGSQAGAMNQAYQNQASNFRNISDFFGNIMAPYQSMANAGLNYASNWIPLYGTGISGAGNWAANKVGAGGGLGQTVGGYMGSGSNQIGGLIGSGPAPGGAPSGFGGVGSG